MKSLLVHQGGGGAGEKVDYCTITIMIKISCKYYSIITKVELLLENKVETKDALLHAINEEYVEAVEV